MLFAVGRLGVPEPRSPGSHVRQNSSGVRNGASVREKVLPEMTSILIASMIRVRNGLMIRKSYTIPKQGGSTKSSLSDTIPRHRTSISMLSCPSCRCLLTRCRAFITPPGIPVPHVSLAILVGIRTLVSRLTGENYQGYILGGKEFMYDPCIIVDQPTINPEILDRNAPDRHLAL